MIDLDELLRSSGVVHHEQAVTNASDGLRSVYLHSGQLLIADVPTRITTVLGSCVAICMWDPISCVGGMNHFMLPANPGEKGPVARFADSATKALVEGLLAAGAVAERLRAKVFGGAAILGLAAGTLGEKNIRAAEWHLSFYHIPIISRDVGGTNGRRLIFRTDNGECTIKNV